MFSVDVKNHHLIIKHCGQIIRKETDQMEPEDCTFLRDLDWVKDALLEAYTLGREDGYSLGYIKGQTDLSNSLLDMKTDRSI